MQKSLSTFEKIHNFNPSNKRKKENFIALTTLTILIPAF